MAPKTSPAKPSEMELISRKIHLTLNDPTVKGVWGAKGLKQWDQVRRIVWVRVISPIESPKQAGGQMQSVRSEQGEQPKPQQGSRVRITRIRVQTLDLHIYGEDEGACDRTVKNLLAAIDLTWPQVTFITEEWTSESPDQAGHTHLPKVVIRATFRLTVADEVAPLMPAAGEAHECGILQEDGSLNSS